MPIVEDGYLTILLVRGSNEIKIDGSIIVKDAEGFDFIRLSCHNPLPLATRAVLRRRPLESVAQVCAWTILVKTSRAY